MACNRYLPVVMFENGKLSCSLQTNLFKVANNFDFDKKIIRRGTQSMKWDVPDGDDVIPMWVADMDFQAAPAIRRALPSASPMVCTDMNSCRRAIIRPSSHGLRDAMTGR